jgi:formylglycine-generating enzyme required for sulfatase activity
MNELNASAQFENSIDKWRQLIEFHFANGTGKARHAKDGWTTSELCVAISASLAPDQVVHRRTLDSWRKANTLPSKKHRVGLFNALFPQGRITSPDAFDEIRATLASAQAFKRVATPQLSNAEPKDEPKLETTSLAVRTEVLAGKLGLSPNAMADIDAVARDIVNHPKPGAGEDQTLHEAARLFVAANCFDSLIEHACFQDDWFSPPMTILPPGEFTLGAAPTDDLAYENERPTRHIGIDYRFAVGIAPVTFQAFDLFCQATNAEHAFDEGWGRGERPAIHVSWNDAQLYIAWLNANTAGGYRLLSETEWEYMARAGTTKRYITANDADKSMGNAAETLGASSKCGSFPSNPWGLQDCLGNVWEWVADNWASSYAAHPADGAPFLTKPEDLRCLRGGSWDCSYRNMRVTDRCRQGANNRVNNVGFRLAKTL